MANAPTIRRRLLRFCASLPEVVRNCLRFRVFFLLPRWFRMPRKIRVAGRRVALRFPREEGIDADFITCVLRNTYGLGHRLGAVDTILDVGANIGFFSLAAREHYPAATIHTYEPNPRIQPLLRANIAGLGIEPHPEALGGREGQVAIIDRGPSDQARTVMTEGSPGGIRQITLETAIERIGGTVDLLKLDCEGAEWEILRPGNCWRAVRSLRLEYHLVPGESGRKAADAITAIGFRIIRLQEYSEDGGVLWAAPEPSLPPR